MYGQMKEDLRKGLEAVRGAGLYKKERIITTPQGPEIKVSTGETVLKRLQVDWLRCIQFFT